ncbi:hypothetical protein [Ekhidna sp.]
MTMTKSYLLSALLFILSLGVQAQSEIKSYSLKKGQVFDIIFLSTKDGTDDIQKDYFKLAFPIAEKGGYTPLNGFAIDSSLQGNYHPEVMVFGAWESIELREKFVANIDKSVPNFHEMRRAIWSNFDLTYWEVSQDYSFDVNPEKFNVVTAYWGIDDAEFQKFRKDWLKQVKESGGNKLIGFLKGSSPFGYEYNPDFLSIVEWESKQAFDSFNAKNKGMDHSSVKHVNQFAIQ